MNNLLEQRVALLEKNLRFYQFLFLTLLIISGGFFFMSFKNGHQAPDVVQAKRFELVDDFGRVLVKISKEQDYGDIATYNTRGTKLTEFFASTGGAGAINTFSRNGNVLFKVTNTLEGGGYMALFNSNVQEVAEWGVTDNESGYFRLNDRYGKKLLWATYTQGAGGYLSLSNNGQELIRFSTTNEGGRIGVYNNLNTRVGYMGAQDNKDGNITVWSSSGQRTGSLPNN